VLVATLCCPAFQAGLGPSGPLSGAVRLLAILRKACLHKVIGDLATGCGDRDGKASGAVLSTAGSLLGLHDMQWALPAFTSAPSISYTCQVCPVNDFTKHIS
jgi:hypothetical protein